MKYSFEVENFGVPKYRIDAEHKADIYCIDSALDKLIREAHPTAKRVSEVVERRIGGLAAGHNYGGALVLIGTVARDVYGVMEEMSRDDHDEFADLARAALADEPMTEDLMQIAEPLATEATTHALAA